MIRIVSRGTQKAVLDSVEELDPGTDSIAAVRFSTNVFSEARKLFGSLSGGQLSAIKVLDEAGQLLFYLVQEEDALMIPGGNRYKVEVNYDGCDLIRESEYLDFKILENKDTYIFSDFEEYSYEIAKLILERYPQRKVLFTDVTAKLFFDHAYLAAEQLPLPDKGNVLYISSAEQRYNVKPFRDSTVGIYSSIVVMANLCWGRKRVRLGNLNPDKTIVIINYSAQLKDGGMGGIHSIINDVLFYANKAWENHWIPVVHLTNTQYMSEQIEDSWTCFFEQITDMTYQEALHSQNVIVGDQNGFTWTPGRILVAPEHRKFTEVTWTKEFGKYVEDTLPAPFKEQNRILGVIARGSDLKIATKAKFVIEDFIGAVKSRYEQDYDSIFLATEETEYLEKFREAFGEKLLFVEQQRISYDFENKKYELIANILDLKGKERTDFGRTYLLVTALLSRCNALVSTIDCGARRLAMRWNDRYDFNEVFYDKSRLAYMEKYYYKALIQKRIKEYVEREKRVIVYGTGQDAQSYIVVNDENRDKILFFDKRAEKENYKFKNIEVKPPQQLADYEQIPIIISSTRYGRSIREELVRHHIAPDRILEIGDFVKELYR